MKMHYLVIYMNKGEKGNVTRKKGSAKSFPTKIFVLFSVDFLVSTV